MTFDQYKAAVGAKVPIAQAFDEATHPFPWTTGPNWHLATGQAPKMAAKPKPRTLASLYPVQNGVDPLAPLAPPYYPPQQSTARPTLADLGQSQFPAANGINPPAPQKKKFGVGNALGILGDVLMAYGGLTPTYGPELAKQRELDQQNSFDREKLNATLELARERALMPKPPTQTDRYVQEVLDPNTPPARRALLRAILTRPLSTMVYGSDGSQTQQFTYPGETDGSDDDWEYSN
jgi:hypothetical protein